MINGNLLRDSIISGANNLANHKQLVNELNVFPVPDGDTGTNMSMTINNALPELRKLPEDCTVEQASSVTASALLRGARGNSGVILSLLFRGFSKKLAGRTTADSADIISSLRKGVDSAYKAVMKPTEGTMLTVARVAAEKAEQCTEQKTPAELWALITEVAKETLAQTPEMLPVLKTAGVVDSGGQGLVYIFEGMLSVFEGRGIVALEEGDEAGEGGKKAELQETEIDTENCYCTEFVVMKTAENKADAVALRAFLESNGTSAVVVDDPELIKCHVHTGDPGRMLSKALEHGWLTKIKIENMLEQYQARVDEKGVPEQETAPAAGNAEFPYAMADPSVEYGFVAVCSGEGLEALFKDLGVDRIVSGGQTMNPSTDDILSAIQSIPAKNVLVLANNKNIVMASEQACALADRKAVVLGCYTIPQGISAMLSFDPDRALSENVIAMNAAAENVITGQVTFAARDSELDGKQLKEGEIMGISGGKLLVVESEPAKAVQKLAKKLVKKTSSFITVIYGADIDEAAANEAAALVRDVMPEGCELNVVYGGQPVYYYYLSIE